MMKEVTHIKHPMRKITVYDVYKSVILSNWFSQTGGFRNLKKRIGMLPKHVLDAAYRELNSRN